MKNNPELIKRLPSIITGFLIRDDCKTVYAGNPAAHIPELTIYAKSGKVPASFADEMIRWIQKNDTKKESKTTMGLFIATLQDQHQVMTVSLTVDTTVRSSMWEIEVRVEIV